MARRRSSLAVAALLVVAGATACSAPDGGAATRLARHFDLRDVSTEREIEAGLLEKVPVGTVEPQIESFLESSGVGKDGLSRWDPADKERRIHCTIKFDPATFGFVKESYGVTFQLDERRTLESIRVEKWLTGL